MPPHAVWPTLFRLASPAAVALAVMAGPVAASAAPRPAAQEVAPPSSAEGDLAKVAVLADARERAARTAAAVDDLKRELGPGHLTDPMPDIDRAFGLASLRTDYADAQRRAAGYRATLGDQHPTLKATEQLMDELRGQLLDATRKALGSAERDAADARSDVASAERRSSVEARNRGAELRTADSTGSIAAPPRRAASPLSLPPAAAPADAPSAAPPVRPAERAHGSLRTLAGAIAAAALAALLAAGAALRLLRPRRLRAAPVPARRVEPALAAPAVPTLRRLTLPLAGEALAERFASPSGQVAEAAAALHATLRAAFGDPSSRMTVLVAPVAGLPVAEADAAAFALALAAAAAGLRPLLMETRFAGRLRGALAPAAAMPTLIEAGGAARTLYRLGPAGATVAVLPCDPGEAEAAASAGARPGTGRLRGLDAFDTVILVGDDAAALAPSVDLLVLAAPAGTAPPALAEAARPLRGAGRPCGAVLIDAEAVPAATPGPRAVPLPRRRLAAEAAPAARLGLRGSIEPNRRRFGG